MCPLRFAAEGGHIGPPYNSCSEMTKRRIQLADGRYLIFYTFAPAARVTRDFEIGAEARPSVRDCLKEKRALRNGGASEEN